MPRFVYIPKTCIHGKPLDRMTSCFNCIALEDEHLERTKGHLVERRMSPEKYPLIAWVEPKEGDPEDAQNQA